jgi:hypothetical protein
MLDKLVRRIPATVIFEADRQAIQIADCSGRRVANFPVSRGIAVALTSAHGAANAINGS